MEETKAERAYRLNTEIVNFLTCGDARGQKWIDHHPEARARAEQVLQQFAASAHVDADSVPTAIPEPVREPVREPVSP